MLCHPFLSLPCPSVMKAPQKARSPVMKAGARKAVHLSLAFGAFLPLLRAGRQETQWLSLKPRLAFIPLLGLPSFLLLGEGQGGQSQENWPCLEAS